MPLDTVMLSLPGGWLVLIVQRVQPVYMKFEWKYSADYGGNEDHLLAQVFDS